MKAINFVTEISKIKPNKLEIKKNTDFSDEFIDAYINDLQIVKKSTNVSISADNAIIDLIFNYDLTNLRILTVSFNKDTDTLEERRFKVKTKWNDQYPYTYGDLLQRLDILLGKGAYTITLSSDKMEMTCMLELKVEKMYDAFKKMIEEIVPLNIILSFGLRYLQNKELEKFSHNNLKRFSHIDIKNRKVLGE